MAVEIQSAVLGKIDVTSRQITQDEIDAYAKFCQERGIINDGSAEGIENGNFVHNYFVNTWNAQITDQNLALAWEQIRSYLKFYGSAAIEYFKLAEQEPDRANGLANWLSTQGQPGQLVNSGDQAYANLRLLLIELRGREINRTTISQAEGRISYKPGPQLHYVPLPRQQNPRQHQADPNQKAGQFIDRNDLVRTADGWRSKNAGEQASDRRAAEPVKELPSTIRGREQSAAQQESEALQGNSHSETSQLAKLFVYDQTNQQIDWIKTRDARRQMQKHFENRRAGIFRQI